MAKTKDLSHNTGEILISALKKLMKNTGWTTRTIIKFIKMEYRVSDPKLSKKVSRALKRGVKLGLMQVKNGRYRLNEMSGLARQMSVRHLRLRRRDCRDCERSKPTALRIRSRTPSTLFY
ncbi:uncharacterized protein LOC128682860 [Plodia interpunctella]|uniref:uncharacterized protein LOC128682860 n=1 Tax=Plodia interpunctella TaxID=58824 RepID=UPI002368E7AD|nr:uncharacterized protein LOC128682860 [Plodia interpunctella]